MKKGDKVICTSVSEMVQGYRNDTDVLANLTKGNEYTVSNIEVSSWHTDINLEGIKGTFNSCLFDVLEINDVQK